MSRSSKADPLRRFLQGGDSQFNYSGGGNTGHHKALQVPAIDRGELRAFQSNARGTSNLLAPTAVNDVQAPTGKEKSLKDVWKKSLFNQAPQIAEIDVETINRVDEKGNVKIVRYLPDRFERGRVQAPQMIVEEVSAGVLHDEGERLMHPQQRRAAHDATVNARQGELALRDGYRAKSKMERTCRMNYPHGALSLAENPYGENSAIFNNAPALQKQNKAAIRKGRGGRAPCDTMGKALSGEETAPPIRPGKQSGSCRPRDSINFEDMFKPSKTKLADII